MCPFLHTTGSSCPPRSCGDGCLSIRLGCSLVAQDHQWQMERTTQVGTYKCARAQSNLSRTAAFSSSIKGRHVLVHTDSASAVYPINHQGGTRSKLGLRVSEQLLTWAFQHFLSLRAVHLPSVQNSVADVLSHQGPPQGNWRLHPEVVEMIWRRYGRAEVDVFASETSTHCPPWYSLMEGTSPLGQDAFGSCLASRRSICLSSNSAYSSNAGKGAMERPQTATGCPQLASAAMVPSAAETTPREAMVPPKETGPSLAAGGTRMASESGSPSALNLAIGSQEPLLASCDQAVIDTVLRSRVPCICILSCAGSPATYLWCYWCLGPSPVSADVSFLAP